MPCIRLVGVGLLGSAMAARLLQHGFEVIGYDTRVTQLEALRTDGGILESEAELNAFQFTLRHKMA